MASAAPGELAGVWVGFVLTLLIFTLLARDNGAARFAQHIVVGASLGFAGVFALQNVLGVRLFAPLLGGAAAEQHLWGALALGLLLVTAGVWRTLEQGKPAPRRRALSLLGRLPVALLLGVGVTTGLLGLVQGTLAPQTLYAVQAGIDWGAAPGAFLSSALALVLAVGSLLALSVDREQGLRTLPSPLRSFAGALLWVGERALWLAAGFLFTRLFASRLSLLIDRIAYVFTTLERTGLQRWLEAIWTNLVG